MKRTNKRSSWNFKDGPWYVGVVASLLNGKIDRFITINVLNITVLHLDSVVMHRILWDGHLFRASWAHKRTLHPSKNVFSLWIEEAFKELIQLHTWKNINAHRSLLLVLTVWKKNPELWIVTKAVRLAQWRKSMANVKFQLRLEEKVTKDTQRLVRAIVIFVKLSHQRVAPSFLVPVDLNRWQVWVNFCPVKKFGRAAPPAATPRLVQKPRDKRTNCQFLLITRLSDLLQTRGFVMNMSPVQKQPWWKKKNPHKASRKIRWRMKVRREFSNKEITALLRSAVN